MTAPQYRVLLAAILSLAALQGCAVPGAVPGAAPKQKPKT